MSETKTLYKALVRLYVHPDEVAKAFRTMRVPDANHPANILAVPIDDFSETPEAAIDRAHSLVPDEFVVGVVHYNVVLLPKKEVQKENVQP